MLTTTISPSNELLTSSSIEDEQLKAQVEQLAEEKRYDQVLIEVKFRFQFSIYSFPSLLFYFFFQKLQQKLNESLEDERNQNNKSIKENMRLKQQIKKFQIELRQLKETTEQVEIDVSIHFKCTFDETL